MSDNETVIVERDDGDSDWRDDAEPDWVVVKEFTGPNAHEQAQRWVANRATGSTYRIV